MRDNNDTQTSHLSLETVCKLLVDDQRRAILHYFIDNDTDVVTFDELSDSVQAKVAEDTTP